MSATIALLLLVCMNGDPDQCMNFPAHPPAHVTQEECLAKANSEFDAGRKNAGEDGNNLALNGYFCGYMDELSKGRED
jgi:hypothetical protein